MDNIHDYVKWMGRFGFDELAFSHIDAMVLSQLSYYDLALMEDYPDLPLSIEGLSARITAERHSSPNLASNPCREAGAFFQSVARSKRYKDIIVREYAEESDRDRAVQFAAASFERRGDFNFIAFRGTDDTLAGWKEDFMISFTLTSSQQLALEFARRNLVPDIKNILGGHSKGANMALYAASQMTIDEWQLVGSVYLLDGPGLCPDVLDTVELPRVRRKAVAINPQFSVIGKLFDPEIPKTIIVQSSAEGLMQHDMYTWGIDHGKLMTAREFDPQAQKINGLISDWLGDIDNEKRKVFVADIFSILSCDGAQTVSDLMKGGADTMENALVKLLGSEESTRDAIAGLPEKAMFGSALTRIKKLGFIKWLSGFRAVRCALLILGGLLLMLASNEMLNYIAKGFFLVLAVAEFVLTVRRLYKVHWDFSMVRERLYLLIILSALCIAVMTRERAVYLLGSMLYGAVALIVAIVSAERAWKKSDTVFLRIIHICEALFAAGFGMSLLIISPDKVYNYSLIVGAALFADGLARLIEWLVHRPHTRRDHPVH